MDIPKISEAEWQVMEVLWAQAPLTSAEVAERLKPQTGWEPTTVYTLIGRLVRKGAVAIREGSTPRVCSPLWSQEEVRRKEGREFLDRIFGGAPALMLRNFIEDQPLTEAQIEDLQRLLDSKKPGARS